MNPNLILVYSFHDPSLLLSCYPDDSFSHIVSTSNVHRKLTYYVVNDHCNIFQQEMENQSFIETGQVYGPQNSKVTTLRTGNPESLVISLNVR